METIKKYNMLINGKYCSAKDGGEFDSINPATGEIWATFPEATVEDVNLAVESADKALNEGPWGKMTPTERGNCLKKLGDLLAEKSEELGKIETTDTGKLLQETLWQAKYIAQFYNFYAGCADKIHGDTLPIDKQDMFVYTIREPLGVVAAIIPWNSQMFLSAVKIGPALAAGNTMVMKLSEEASAVILEFGQLFEKAGIPPGVINLITGHGDPCGKTLTSHPKVARVSFTGGSNAAKHVIANTSKNLAQVSLELGGKSPFIVFEDADIQSAVNSCVSGIFGASGQSCVAGSRLYLEETIADEFMEKLKITAASIRIGDPLDEDTEMGPLCSLSQLKNIQNEIDNAVIEGGKIICGGKRFSGSKGFFYEPTIVECPNQHMRIVDTELFGPVLCVLKFRNEEEAIQLANSTRHGLAAGVFTKHNARVHRMVKAIKAGIVWVNTYRAVSPIAEFGGVKNSGFGRESGFQAVYDYTRPKTVWINTSDESLGSQFVIR